MFGALAQLGATQIGSAISMNANRRALREARRNMYEGADERGAEIYADSRGTTRALASLDRMADQRKQRAEARRGAQAVVGGTNASVAAQEEADAQAQATMEANMLANDEARKDALKAQDRAMRAQDNANIASLKAKQQANIAGAISGAAQAGAGIASAYMGDGTKKSPEAKTAGETSVVDLKGEGGVRSAADVVGMYNKIKEQSV